MTDCNSNQPVVKVQIEHDAQPCKTNKWPWLTSQQPNRLRQIPPVQQLTSLCTQDPAEVQTPEENQSTTAPSSSLARAVPDASDVITIDTNESGKPTHFDLDPQTSDAGASLSDLDRIGLGVGVT